MTVIAFELPWYVLALAWCALGWLSYPLFKLDYKMAIGTESRSAFIFTAIFAVLGPFLLIVAALSLCITSAAKLPRNRGTFKPGLSAQAIADLLDAFPLDPDRMRAVFGHPLHHRPASMRTKGQATMPFNSDTYYENKFRKEAYRNLGLARAVKRQKFDGEPPAWQRDQIRTLVRQARTCMHISLSYRRIRNM